MPRKDQEGRREYHRAYMRKWYMKNKSLQISRVRADTVKRRNKLATFINEFKRRPCADCGGEFPPYLMDLITSLARSWTTSAACGRVRSHARRSGPRSPNARLSAPTAIARGRTHADLAWTSELANSSQPSAIGTSRCWSTEVVAGAGIEPATNGL
jgi:hypothetical protein